MEKRRIAIVFGGKSTEHEVSLMSAASVIRAIDKEKFDLVYIGITKQGEWKKIRGGKVSVPDILENGNWQEFADDFDMGHIKDVADFALPIVHGTNCEDGKLQGFFETVGIPYGGCGVLASALAMDKLAAKDVFEKVGFPQCKHKALLASRYFKDKEKAEKEISEALGYPCFVKPANLGSSVGITKAHDREEFFEACDLAFKYDKRVVVEENVNAREIEAAILGNENPEAAELGEIIPTAEFYDYEAKYHDDSSKLVIPAEVSPEMREEIRHIAVKAYEAIDGEGFARVDFFVEKETGKIYLNEINTIPGFTKTSMFPMLWEAAGVSYPDVVERIIELGYERYNNQNSRQTVL